MIDLVGDDENQLPAQLKTVAVLAQGFESKAAHIQSFVSRNPDKKIMIFTQTKQEARSFESLKFANFLPIHGDLVQSQRERALALFRRPGSQHILVGTDVAARGLDVDDVDVVIQCSCNKLDDYVHRSGRTARRGKDGLSILFIGPQELRFALDLEKQLNISMDFVSQLGAASAIGGSAEADEEANRFGKHVQKLQDDASRRHRDPAVARGDPAASRQIYDALASEELEDMDRQKCIEFLIEYYVGRTIQKVGTVGFVSGKTNCETHMIEGLDGTIANKIVDKLKNKFGMKVSYARGAASAGEMNVVFDVRLEDLPAVSAFMAESEVEMQSVEALPAWAKQLLQRGPQLHGGDGRDRYSPRNRSDSYRPNNNFSRDNSGPYDRSQGGDRRGGSSGHSDRSSYRGDRDSRDRPSYGSQRRSGSRNDAQDGGDGHAYGGRDEDGGRQGRPQQDGKYAGGGFMGRRNSGGRAGYGDGDDDFR